MKTAKEVLKNEGVQYDCLISMADYNAVEAAMEEYAKQEAIEFAEWVRRRYERYATGWVQNANSRSFLSSIEKDDILTTEELYKTFKK